MMRWLVFVLVVLFSLSAFSSDRRDELLEVLDQELHEVVRLNKQLGGKRPDLMLRMAELFLEKARVIKEQENEKFLAIPQKKRASVNKNKYFKRSRKYFVQAQKTCETILKRFKNFSSKADVYYIMAYNSKEFNQQKKARKYFKYAVSQSSRGSVVSVKSTLALAELYFINGQFRDAIPLYEKTLRKKKDQWWTKDSYNLAWCYYRTGNAKKAIAKLKEVYKYSKKSKFVDMSLNVERDLAVFYAETGNAGEAIKFYKQKSGDYIKDLLNLSKHLTTKGKYIAAESMLNKALREKPDDEDEIEIRLRLLELHEKFGKGKKHLAITESLMPFWKKKKIKGNYFERYVYQVKKMSAKLQKQVIGKTYKHRKKLRTLKMKRAGRYFSILAQIEPSNAEKTYFHMAETYYANGWYSTALKYYELSLKEAKTMGNKKYESLALNGLMAIMSMKGIKKKEKYMEYTYISYLNRYPKGKRAFKLYQRLFKLQLKKKKIADAEKTLGIFKKRYPKYQKKQEAMIAEIMEQYRVNKKTEDIKRWVGLINSGEYVVTKAYAKKLHELLLAMEFASVEKASAAGNKRDALRGYLKIYSSPKSTSLAKKQAAYNIAILFHELHDVKRTYDWSLKSLSLMDQRDAVRFRGEFVLMATEMFNRQEFDRAEKLYTSYFKKVCHSKLSRKDIILKNAVVIYLANNKVSSAIDLVSYGERCNISRNKIEDIMFDIAKVAAERKQWSAYELMATQLQKRKGNYCRLIATKGLLMSEYRKRGKVATANQVEQQILQYYHYCKKKRIEIEVDSLDVIAQIELDALKTLANSLGQVELSFPERNYNARLKLMFSKLDAITSKAISILKIGSGKGIVTSYMILVKSYRQVVSKMRAFVPPNKSPQYVKSFRKSMVELSRPIAMKASEFFNDAKRQIEKNEILSSDNAWFFRAPRLPMAVEYTGDGTGIIMDRGGVK